MTERNIITFMDWTAEEEALIAAGAKEAGYGDDVEAYVRDCALGRVGQFV